MTNEEKRNAFHRLKVTLDELENNSDEDSISREAKKIDEWDICGKPAELWVVNGKIQIRHRGTIHNVALSSIQPKARVGHWKSGMWENVREGFIPYWMCSECGRQIDGFLVPSEADVLRVFPYCHCGAKMVESQESEG